MHDGQTGRNAVLRVVAYVPDCSFKARGRTQAEEMLGGCRVYKKEAEHDAEIVLPAGGKLEDTTGCVKLRRDASVLPHFLKRKL